MREDDVKISVIVPVYNVKRYLRSCLDSILSQSFRDMEIICVDDGSTDGSGEILDEYSCKDDRIRVIHKENGGYGRAMNAGIDEAKGEYIGIVESDDAILPDFYETLYRTVKDNDLDIVKSECYFWWEEQDYRFRCSSGYDKYYGKVLGKERLWLRCLFLMNTWTGLYRRSFLAEHDIRHHESPGASYQDNGFWMQGMIFADRVMLLDYAGYQYRQDNESASVRDPHKVYAMVDEYEWLAKYMEGKVERREMDVINAFRLIRGYWSFYRIADDHKREFTDRLISDYRKYGDVFFRDIRLQELYLPIMESADDFCGKVIGAKKFLEQKMDEADSIVIYGAGKRGERIYRMLLNYGWITKLQCFIETEAPKKEKIGKHHVYRMDDSIVRYGGAAVIISAAKGSRYYSEMQDRLAGHDAGVTLDSELLFDNYYNLT